MAKPTRPDATPAQRSPQRSSQRSLQPPACCALLQAVPMPSYLADAQGLILAANLAAAKEHGYLTSDELLGLPLASLFPPEATEEVDRLLADALSQRQVQRMEYIWHGQARRLHLTPIPTPPSQPGRVAAHVQDVTAERKADETFRRERQRQHFLMESLPGFVLLVTREGIIRYANRSFRRAFGSPRDTDCHRLLGDVEHPCPCCPPARIFEEAHAIAWEWTGPDGRIYELRASPMTDVDGVTVALVFGVDITERKAVESALARSRDELSERVFQRTRELAASEARYRAVVEDQTEFISRFTPDLNLTFINQALARFSGKDPEELLGPFTLDAVQEDMEAAQHLLAPRAPGEDQVRTAELRLRRADGAMRWVRWSVRALPDEHGSIAEFLAVGRDITARKRAEERYRKLLQNLPVVVMAIRPDLSLEFVNNASRHVLGIDPEDALSQPPAWFLEQVHPDDRQYVENRLRACFDDQPPRQFTEFRFQHRGGFILHLSARFFPESHDPGEPPTTVESVILDVTERTVLNQLLRQRDRLNILGAVSAEMAHRMRNPLVPLGGYARRLAKQHPELAEAPIILQETLRLEELLDAMGAYLKPDPGEATSCALDSIVRFSIEIMSATIERSGLQIDLALDTELPPVLCNPDLLTQAFLNLISTATRAAEDAGRGRLTIAAGEYPDAVYLTLRLTPSLPDTSMVEDLALPFADHPASHGLALIRRLVADAGGQIEVREEPDATLATITLPYLGAPLTPAQPTTQPTH